MEQVNFGWRKSSYSGNVGAGSCVELGQTSDCVMVRDTEEHGRGPVVRVAPGDWRRFTSLVKQP